MREQLTKSQFHRKAAEQNDGLKPAAKLLLRQAHVIHGPAREEHPVDIFIENGKIVDYQPHIAGSFAEDVIIFDLQGKLVFPGFLDLHVHFREPGREDEETLHSGAEAAMAGGFTAVCTMPNTEPVTDSREIIEFIHREMKQHLVSVYPIAAISRGQKGEELVEMAELVEAGAVGFSDDGKSVANSLLLRRALEYSRMFGVPIIEHCEDANLAADGAMHEGFVATNLGLPAIPSIAEDIVVARNIMLAEYTQGKLHIAHVSTAGAVELIRRAKAKGIAVTAEATPHHFTLTDESVQSFDTNFKMNPPLRSMDHLRAIVAGLCDGTIDAIATDHAPHSLEEKEVEFIAAPFGIIGLETAIGLVNKQLVQPGKLSWDQVVTRLCHNPYRIIGQPAPEIKIGAIANLTIIDPEQQWIVDKNRLKSRSKNTPFHGWELPGRVFAVMNNGYYYLNNLH